MKQPDRTLVAALDPFMTAHGFKFIKLREAYIRKTPSGFDEFTWSSYPLATGEKWAAGYYDGGYGLGLRCNAVQEIWNVLGISYGGDPKGHRPTVYRAVSSPNVNLAFDPTRDREFCLRFDHLEEDVSETAARIETMMEADGWAWYERYTNPVLLSQDINTPLEGLGPHPLLNNSSSRPLVGIAAACVGEPDKVSELATNWLAILEEWDRQYAEQRPPVAPDFANKFNLMIDKAHILGLL